MGLSLGVQLGHGQASVTVDKAVNGLSGEIAGSARNFQEAHETQMWRIVAFCLAAGSTRASDILQSQNVGHLDKPTRASYNNQK